MKTEKIEIWVDDPSEFREIFYAGCTLDADNYSIARGTWSRYKVTLEIEMPEREGIFTESELFKWVRECFGSPRSGHVKCMIDKLFNGDFKE